jgi:hypothetical protein
MLSVRSIGCELVSNTSRSAREKENKSSCYRVPGWPSQIAAARAAASIATARLSKSSGNMWLYTFIVVIGD